MKRTIILLMMIAAVAMAFADADSARRAKELVQGNKTIDDSELGSVGAKLSDLERLYAYDAAVSDIESKLPLAMGLNYFIGFGIGSFYQGDSKGATGILIGSLACNAAFIGGIVLIYAPLFAYMYSSDSTDSSSDPFSLSGSMMGGFALMSLGSLGSTIVRIIEIIRPFQYAKERRQSIKRGLFQGISRAPSFEPAIAICPAAPGSGLPAAIGLGLRVAL